VNEQTAVQASPLVVVTLVHGTWGGDTPWTKDGSPLREAIECQLDSRTRFRCFKWSGINTHHARLTAGKELGQYLWQGIREFPEARHVVVTHSHGGNVLLYALRDRALQDKVSAAVCMGTPFIYCVERNIRGAIDYLQRYKVAVFVSIYFAIVLIGGLLMEILDTAFPGWFENSTSGTLFVVASWAAILGVAFLFSRGLKQWPTSAPHVQQRVIEELQPPQVISVPFLCVSFVGDEAGLVLKAVQAVANVPFWLWRFVERLQVDGFDRVFGTLCVALLGIMVLHFFGVQVPSGVVISLFALLLGSILFAFLGGTFLMAGLMVLMPAAKFARAHNFGFGWEPAVNHVLVNVVQQLAPATVSPRMVELVSYDAKEAALRLGLSARAFRLKYLFHTLIYTDPKVTNAVARWLASRVAD